MDIQFNAQQIEQQHPTLTKSQNMKRTVETGLVDNKTGQMYYYNRRTNETSWTVPLGLTKEQIKMNSKLYGGGATKVGTHNSV
jgi:hypothetical protein